MKSSHDDKLKEQGRAIARGMREEKARHQKHMTAAAKRRATLLETAADKMLSGTNQ